MHTDVGSVVARRGEPGAVGRNSLHYEWNEWREWGEARNPQPARPADGGHVLY